MLEFALWILLILLSCSFIIFSLDEVFVDFYYWFIARSKSQWRVSFNQINTGRLQPIAILIPAWQEASIICEMLETSLDLINYPKSKYHIFVGCYPNDEPTIQAVQEASQKFYNVHLVVNPKAGPTNKADNMNSIIQGLINYETEFNIKFDIVVLQDAEDVIHPLSLKLFNYLIPPVDMLQLPVFPFDPPGTIKGFFTHLTQGTYADEFAENHLRIMVVRNQLRTFVPSAGVGTALRREVLEEISATSAPFDTSQLTEDYELALRLKSLGYKTYFFLEGVERLLPNGETITERIAIREFFPNTFQAATRQKERWIYGITFQAPRTQRKMIRNWADNYAMYRDIKARWANLIIGPGYLVLLFTLGVLLYSYFTGTTPWYDTSSAKAWETVYLLSIIATALAAERQIMRGLALAELYGARQALMAMLIPPLLPIRMIWGNVINFVATLRAWQIFLFGTPAQRKKWAKTEHREYAPESFLRAYKRKLGDLALQNKIISSQQLYELLSQQKLTGKPLGKLMLEQNMVDETTYTQLLSQHYNLDYLNLTAESIDPALAHLLPYRMASDFHVVPLVASRTTTVVATPEPLTDEIIDALQTMTKRQITQILAPAAAINRALEIMYSSESSAAHTRLGRRLLQAGIIDEFQLIEALQIQANTERRLGDILVSLGYVQREQIDMVTSR